ncbi:unnamed protein product [Rotaria sp. Silwood2]|nr:unnamed protein product [Rotaria sp. Silwood2]CAF2999333.1 unnamed protein product [Rotaria sp. Silwood2]CAF3059594.1 unnamed protein product [Rotaria sp. Silwood2]CAF3366740.1 unnamed protein product [Rotaria sp. Silwood2]CAF4132057.1 unnamed protein product [Rotaria sp. Silwood2]
MKCKLSIELLVKHDFLRNNDKCTFCSEFIATHFYQKEVEKEISKSNMHVQYDNIKIKDNVNYEYERLANEKKDKSLSQPDFMYCSNVSPPSLSSNSNASESVKSSASAEALTRVHSSTVCPDFETDKNNGSMTRTLEDQAMRAASEEQSFLCKEFLKKHYCSHTGSNNFEELYVRILSVIKEDNNRVYYLMKHARHSCFGLVKVTKNDDQLLALFKFLDDFLQ